MTVRNKKPTTAYFRYKMGNSIVKIKVAGYSTISIPTLEAETQIVYPNQDKVRRNSELLANTFDWFQVVT